jgi:hypothetical protein
MRKYLALAVVLVSTLPAAKASDRTDLSDETLAKVAKVDKGFDRLRVYLSRKLIVVRSARLSERTDVGGGVDTILQDKVLTETIARSARGKILFQDDAQANETSPYDFARGRKNVIYVTFDPGCQTRDCAFAFAKPYERECSRWGGRCWNEERSNDYLLVGLPKVDGYTSVKVFSKRFLKKAPLSYRDNAFQASKDKRTLRLQVNESELTEVIREKIEHPGFDN